MHRKHTAKGDVVQLYVYNQETSWDNSEPQEKTHKTFNQSLGSTEASP